MKKTININLAGYPFIIDEDAYNMLKDYLDTIRYAFETPDDPEDLARDIESRIAEIIFEKDKGKERIISAEEISSIITRIGRPSEFMETIEIQDPEETAEEAATETKCTPPPYEANSTQENIPFKKKKLFRDPQNALLGGVCSGLAIYLNMDPTILRLVTVALFFLSGSVVALVYIIMWIVVPAANTPLQRMQMKGEDPTMENIGKSVTENYCYDETRNPEPRNERSGFWKFVYICCSVFVKCLVVLGLIIAIPVGLALFVILIACIVALCLPDGLMDNAPFLGDMISKTGYGAYLFHMILSVIGVIISIGVPVWLIYNRKFKGQEYNLSNRRSLVVLWIAGIALTSVFIPKTVKDAKRIDNDDTSIANYLQKYDWDGDIIDTDDEDIQELSVTSTGVRAIYKDGTVKIISPSGVKIIRTTTQEVTDTVTESKVSTDSISNKTDNKF